MSQMAKSSKITTNNIEAYMYVNQGICQTIRDVITYNQIMTAINENIAFARTQAKVIDSNQLNLL